MIHLFRRSDQHGKCRYIYSQAKSTAADVMVDAMCNIVKW